MGAQSPARRAGDRRGALAKRERKLAALANRQHGVISRRQLIAAGLGARTVGRRIEAGRLHPLHGGVYAFGRERVSVHGEWMAAVLACGVGALLSHRSAAALWGLIQPGSSPAEVTAATGRQRRGIAVHEGGISDADRTEVRGIPVTTVARTLFDLAEIIDEARLARAFEEADRLGLLRMQEVEAVCARGYGRRALRPVRHLIDEAWLPATTRSALEDRVLTLCREHDLPTPATNVTVLGHEVDAFWPRQKLVIEADGWTFHRHRAAFERDRARDAAMQAEGYRVIRLTHRRMEREPTAVAAEIRRLLKREGRAGA
jgi:very-short-patch-repair endonuclease/predicted transcriptional regulator of viral defense system